MTTKRRADEDIVSDMINAKLDVMSDRIAGMMGPAPGTENVTGKHEIELWDERDPAVDIMAEYQKALTQGMDDLSAQSAATVKAYPNRGPMLLAAGADDESRVKYARRMRRLSEQGGAQDVSGPIY